MSKDCGESSLGKNNFHSTNKGKPVNSAMVPVFPGIRCPVFVPSLCSPFPFVSLVRRTWAGEWWSHLRQPWPAVNQLPLKPGRGFPPVPDNSVCYIVPTSALHLMLFSVCAHLRNLFPFFPVPPWENQSPVCCCCLSFPHPWSFQPFVFLFGTRTCPSASLTFSPSPLKFPALFISLFVLFAFNWIHCADKFS